LESHEIAKVHSRRTFSAAKSFKPAISAVAQFHARKPADYKRLAKAHKGAIKRMREALWK
jgi:hypothetical protein